MSNVIAPLGPAQSPLNASTKDQKAEKLKQAAGDFESLLVKQLLSAAKMGGEAKGGYGDMAVDALASGVEKGGGLGLSKQIERALLHSEPDGSKSGS